MAKRQTKVEEALQAQSDALKHDMDLCDEQVILLQAKRQALWDVKSRCDAEISRLRRVREHTPPKAKP